MPWAHVADISRCATGTDTLHYWLLIGSRAKSAVIITTTVTVVVIVTYISEAVMRQTAIETLCSINGLIDRNLQQTLLDKTT